MIAFRQMLGHAGLTVAEPTVALGGQQVTAALAEAVAGTVGVGRHTEERPRVFGQPLPTAHISWARSAARVYSSSKTRHKHVAL